MWWLFKKPNSTLFECSFSCMLQVAECLYFSLFFNSVIQLEDLVQLLLPDWHRCICLCFQTVHHVTAWYSNRSTSSGRTSMNWSWSLQTLETSLQPTWMIQTSERRWLLSTDLLMSCWRMPSETQVSGTHSAWSTNKRSTEVKMKPKKCWST